MLVINFQEKSGRQITRSLNDRRDSLLIEAHERARREQQEQQRRSRRRRTGAVRLSNMDTVTRAKEVRGRLMAKIREIAGSDMEPRARDARIAEVQKLITRVEQQIAAIRRRERAVEEERSVRRRNDSPEERRRRWRDKQERRIYIRRDFLYHASRGGFDPNNPMNKIGVGELNAFSPVAIDIGGITGTVDIPMDISMEIVL